MPGMEGPGDEADLDVNATAEPVKAPVEALPEEHAV